MKNGKKLRPKQAQVLKRLQEKRTLAQLSRAVGTPPCPLGRCMKSLVDLGYVRRDRNGNYERTSAGAAAVSRP